METLRVGRFGLGERNRNGDHLVDFCEVSNIALTNTFFNHHKRRRYTWTSPCGTYRNQIDYTAVQKKWMSSVVDAVSKPGADCDTDHQMVTAKLRMKTGRNKNKGKVTIKYDIESLNDSEIAHKIQRGDRKPLQSSYRTKL